MVRRVQRVKCHTEQTQRRQWVNGYDVWMVDEHCTEYWYYFWWDEIGWFGESNGVGAHFYGHFIYIRRITLFPGRLFLGIRAYWASQRRGIDKIKQDQDKVQQKYGK